VTIKTSWKNSLPKKFAITILNEVRGGLNTYYNRTYVTDLIQLRAVHLHLPVAVTCEKIMHRTIKLQEPPTSKVIREKYKASRKEKRNLFS